MKNKILKVQKRDESIVDFDESRIKEAIFKSLTSTKKGGIKKADILTKKVIEILNRRFKQNEIPHVEQIQDIVEEVLILEGLTETQRLIFYIGSNEEEFENQLL
jgi:anaerobic ribonucleoside-triphosphate reductase